MFVRRLILNKVHNMRDLGGYATLDNSSTAFGKFLRSSAVYNLLDDEVNYLLIYGVKTVIDLREKREIALKPNTFQNIKSVKYFNIPVLNMNKSRDIDSGSTFNDYTTYLKIVDNFPKMNQVFSTMVDNIEGVTLFNCQLGKDRTGVIAALLLMLANVSLDDIMGDYSISYINVKNLRKLETKKSYNMPKKLLKINQMIDYANTKYDSIMDYFFDIGLTYADIIKLKMKLVSSI